MIKRKLKQIVSVLFVLLSSVSILLTVIPFSTQAKGDSNPATWILCGTNDGKSLYNAATTDIVPYTLRSKSANTSTNSVDSFLNLILETSGFNFDKVNQKILGRQVTELNSSGATTTKKVKGAKPVKLPKTPNKKAKKVNPFDRFGVEGLNWSSYSGEWKYYDVDGCSTGNNVGPTQFGKFYTKREEPKTTYDGVDNSADPRTQQFSRGTYTAWGQAFNDLITNFLFGITKTIVAFTVALISFAFVDVSDVIGLNSVSGGFLSMFKNLYSGLFQPLLVLMMMLTGVYVLYVGIIKRQFRTALVNGLGGSILCLFAAFVIGMKPSFWIPLPNEIATYGEAIVVNSLGTKQHGDKGALCSTNVEKMTKPHISTKFGKKQEEQLKKTGVNMRSVIGCKMWSQFLLRPWVQGQFGTSYSHLNVKKVDNANKKWVGEPAVPVGNNKVIKNWALFQISLQTNAHAQLASGGKFKDDPKANIIKTVDGTSVDWWRITDAFSNYNETKHTSSSNDPIVTGKMPTNGLEGADYQNTTLKPLSEWQSWIGNRQVNRYGTALLSILFSVIGGIGPLLFAFIAAIYSVGVTLLMAVSPIFFLLGTWAGNGRRIFKGWAANLLSLIVKKIVSSALVLISFDLSMTGMDLVDKIGWIQSLMLLSILTTAMIRSRRKIFEVFASFNFGTSFSPMRQIASFAQGMQHQASDAAFSSSAILYGAHKAKKLGMSYSDGIKISAAEQARLKLRRSTFGKSLLYEKDQGGARSGNRIACIICGKTINPGEEAYRDNDGNYYCIDCGDELSTNDDLYLFTAPKGKVPNKRSLKKQWDSLRKQDLRAPLNEKDSKLSDPGKMKFNNMYGTSNKSWMSYSHMQDAMNVHQNPDGTFDWDEAEVIKEIQNNIGKLERDIQDYDKAFKKYGNQAETPSIPEPLTNYLDPVELSQAYRSGRYDIVRASYRQAWNNWYDTNTEDLNNHNDNNSKAFARNINPDGAKYGIDPDSGYAPTNMKSEFVPSADDSDNDEKDEKPNSNDSPIDSGKLNKNSNKVNDLDKNSINKKVKKPDSNKSNKNPKSAETNSLSKPKEVSTQLNTPDTGDAKTQHTRRRRNIQRPRSVGNIKTPKIPKDKPEK